MAQTPFMDIYRGTEGMPHVGADGEPLYDMTGPEDEEIYVPTEDQIVEELGSRLMAICADCGPQALRKAGSLTTWIAIRRLDYSRAVARLLEQVNCTSPRPALEFATPGPDECGVVELRTGQTTGAQIS